MLEFIDCPKCSKRVRKQATHCHHCNYRFTNAVSENGSPEQADGGYDESQDDFDYDEFLEREFESKPPIRKLWVYVAWGLLFAMLVPIALQIMAAIQSP